MVEFPEFTKIARLSRECTITEKIDGTNASIYIGEGGEFLTGTRTRWIVPSDDHFGFSAWANAHKDDLMLLGLGHHFGEWWGSGIQRGYGLIKGEKRFSLFNTARWLAEDAILPLSCSVVPVLFRGPFTTEAVSEALSRLTERGSMASPGFMKAEGVIIWHAAARIMFKKTILKDEEPKGFSIKAPAL